MAFFSGVDIDTVLRKEVSTPCLTPSNKDPIPPGECLDMYQLLKKCNTLEPTAGHQAQPRDGNHGDRAAFEVILKEAAARVSSSKSRVMSSLPIDMRLEWLRLQEGVSASSSKLKRDKRHG